MLAGVAARAWVWTHRGSLFLDEASLALNVLARGFGGLTQPLDWGQVAPVGYLWIERAAFLALGPGEVALRSWSFVAGVATLPLTWLVARRLAGARAAAFAVTALACSLIAIRYSGEVKPYAGDALAAVGLTWLALRVGDDPADARRWAWLGACGVVALLASLPSVFTLAAASAALAGVAWRGGHGMRTGFALCGAAWLTAFGVEWLAVLRHSVGDPYLTEYWAPVMLHPSQPALAARVFRAAASVAATPLRWEGSLAAAAAGVGAWACGLVVMGRRSRTGLVLLAAPVAFSAAASVAGAYPLSDRLAFFAAPTAMIAMGVALDAVVRPAGTAAGAALLALWVGSDGVRVVRSPGSLEPARELFRGVAAAADSAHAPVYVFARAVPAWLYATSEWRSPDRARLDRYVALAGNVRSPAHENFARDGAVLAGTGDSLVVRAMRGGREELVGLAPGVRYRVVGPTSRDGPSPGWAREEARRIRAAARPAAWVVASHYFEGTPRDELRPLVEAMAESGLAVTDARRGGRDAIALRVEAVAKRGTGHHPGEPGRSVAPPPKTAPVGLSIERGRYLAEHI